MRDSCTLYYDRARLYLALQSLSSQAREVNEKGGIEVFKGLVRENVRETTFSHAYSLLASQSLRSPSALGKETSTTQPSFLIEPFTLSYKRSFTLRPSNGFEVRHHRLTDRGRCGGLRVSVPASGLSNPDLSHACGHCVVFMRKTLYSHSASLHTDV